MTGGTASGALGIAIGTAGVAMTVLSGSPALILNFGGSTQGSLFYNNTNGVLTLQQAGSLGSYAIDNTGTGYVSGNLAVTGTVSQGSDARGKHAMEPADDGLEVVRRLMPKRFVRNRPEPRTAPPERTELGFVAQDVQPVLGEAVVASPLDQRLGLDVMPLIAVLVNAVKQMDARLAALEGA